MQVCKPHLEQVKIAFLKYLVCKHAKTHRKLDRWVFALFVVSRVKIKYTISSECVAECIPQTGIAFYVLKSAIPIHFYVLKNVDDGIKNGYTKNMD